MRRTTLLLALTLALMLTGCASEQIVRPAAPPMPVWSGPSAEATAGWAPLLDPTLSALQTKALQANTDIRRAALAWQQAQTQARLQGLRLQPNASLSYSANRPLQSQGSSIVIDGVSVPVGNSAEWSHNYSASIGVGFEADLWGRLSQLDMQQLALSEAARSDIQAARILIASQVAENYWTLAANRQLEVIARRKLELSEQLVPLVRLRVKEGKLVPLEINKASTIVMAARQQLAQSKAAADTAQLNLAQLMDQPSTATDRVDAQLPNQNGGPLPAWLPDEPAQVLERRPDVQRARLEVDAALANARATRAARYPTLSFSGGLSTGGQHLSDWLKQPLLSLAGNLVIPMIDWRRLELQGTQAQTQLDSAALNLRSTVYKALTEVQTQVVQAQSLQAQAEATTQRLAEDVETERLAKLKFEVGTIARSDELNARIARLDAEQSVLQLRLNELLTRLALLRALAVPLS
ncbi:MAG TPA: TolC family protein [Burkholderiaceae bacterium]